MVTIFLKTSLRSFWKNKFYNSLNIFGLAVGIACAALIFLWTEDELTWDHNQKNLCRLYDLRENISYAGQAFTSVSTPRPMAAAIRNEIPGIVNTARLSDGDVKLLFNLGEKSVYASGRYADPSLFSMFTLPFLEGNPATAFSNLNSVVITAATAKKFFGGESNVVGKTLKVDSIQYVVTGVLAGLPANSSLQFEWLIPYEENLITTKAYQIGDPTNWASYGPRTYVQLSGNASPAAINRQLQGYIHGKDQGQTTQSFLFPMRDWHLHDEFANGRQTGGGGITQVRMLVLIAWIILLIACINFMNLATARSEKRAKEVGIRKVLGSDKRNLVVQFLSETLMMSLLAGLLALILIWFSLPLFNELMHKQLALQLGNPLHLFAWAAVVLICGIVAGSYPSFYLSSFNPVSVLRGLKVSAGSAAFIRKGLVIFQFAISVFFIISTLVVYFQIQHVKNRPLGFDRNNLVEVDMQHDVAGSFAVIKEDLLGTGFVKDLSLADRSFLYRGNADNRFKWKGKPENENVSISFRNVSPEFFGTAGMTIIEGRGFDPGSSMGQHVVISESLAKILGDKNVIGKIIQSPRFQPDGMFENLTVIGVVSDYVYGNVFHSASDPVIFFCKPMQSSSLIYLRLKTGINLPNALAKIKETVEKDNGSYPFQYRFTDEQFNEMFAVVELTSELSTVFASLAILISCLGLFGLAAYTTQRRVREIAVRKVLGASVAGITGLLSKDFLQLVGLACLIAFPAAWWIMHDWLQHYEFRIAMSWWIYLAAGLSAISIALFTISFQSIKAARTNPVKNLRSE